MHVLLAQGREEANWDKAQEKYRAIQKHIVTGGDQLELYGDVDRLIPDDVDPVCEEQVMPVEEYVREKVKDRGSRAADSPREAAPGNKVKRNMDPGRNIPEGTSAAFMPVSQLVEKAAERILQEGMTLDDDASVKDKSDSRDLEESFSHLRRATSDTGPIPAASKVQTARKRNETTVNEGKRKRAINTPARGSHKKTPGQRKRTKVSNGEANQVLGEGDGIKGHGRRLSRMSARVVAQGASASRSWRKGSEVRCTSRTWARIRTSPSGPSAGFGAKSSARGRPWR